jgi:3',5'-cyclic AMP phosphodiesterase CpdA
MGISRRQFLTSAAAGTTGLWLTDRVFATPKPAAAPEAQHEHEPFTFVHLTDMHVTPKRMGHVGYRACIDTVRALKPKPAFALMGGDLAFDGLYNPKPDFDEQIRLYREISDSLGFPYYNCMGNHDVLGWSPRRKVAATDPDIGKKMIMDRLEWEQPYYSFDHHGWHFAVLDCIHPVKADHGPAYEPRIGPEQLEWLAYDLGAAGTRPKVVVTHIAAFCNMGQQQGNPNRKAMDGSMVLWDTKELRLILQRHGVKALLQGHSHEIEEYHYKNVWYITSAAVSGAWWAGDWAGSPPGYTLFTCDGDKLTWEHRPFDWEPRLEPDDDLERQKIAELRAFQAEQARLLRQERTGQRPAATSPPAAE